MSVKLLWAGCCLIYFGGVLGGYGMTFGQPRCARMSVMDKIVLPLGWPMFLAASKAASVFLAEEGAGIQLCLPIPERR